MRNTYQEITEARELLELPARTTLQEIKSHYRRLLTRWHPDKCPDKQETCHEMTTKIIAAYMRIMTYCDQYNISFEHQDVKDYVSPEEWWFERFGNDPVWGVGNYRKSS
jgi:preprotein translocase subunit Sec63